MTTSIVHVTTLKRNWYWRGTVLEGPIDKPLHIAKSKVKELQLNMFWGYVVSWRESKATCTLHPESPKLRFKVCQEGEDCTHIKACCSILLIHMHIRHPWTRFWHVDRELQRLAPTCKCITVTEEQLIVQVYVMYSCTNNFSDNKNYNNTHTDTLTHTHTHTDSHTQMHYSPLGCQISVINFILGGLWGYSLGKSKWALK